MREIINVTDMDQYEKDCKESEETVLKNLKDLGSLRNSVVELQRSGESTITISEPSTSIYRFSDSIPLDLQKVLIKFRKETLLQFYDNISNDLFVAPRPFSGSDGDGQTNVLAISDDYIKKILKRDYDIEV